MIPCPSAFLRLLQKHENRQQLLVIHILQLYRHYQNFGHQAIRRDCERKGTEQRRKIRTERPVDMLCRTAHASGINRSLFWRQALLRRRRVQFHPPMRYASIQFVDEDVDVFKTNIKQCPGLEFSFENDNNNCDIFLLQSQ